MVKKIAALLVAACMLIPVTTGAYAEEATERIDTIEDHEAIYYQVDGGISVRQGGMNQIDGVICQNRSDSIKLEERLREENYILVSTSDKDISDEEYEILCEGEYQPPYYQYFDESDSFNQMYRVYLYKPCYEAAIEQLKKNGVVTAITKGDIATSTVVVNYAEWYEKERIGKVVNEINDNIPDWFDTGYMEIITSIDAEITLEYGYTHTLDIVYVEAYEPFVVKVPQGAYYVKEINGIELTNDEEAVPEENNIQVTEEHTLENPYVLDLRETSSALGIKPIDISGQPDYSWENRDNVEITTEETVIETTNDATDSTEPEATESSSEASSDELAELTSQAETTSTVSKSTTIWRLIFIGVFLLIAIICLIIYKVIKKKNSR